MDEQQKVLRRVFTQEQLEAMDPEDIKELLGRPGARLRGTAVVRKANGDIKYDPGVDPAQFEEGRK